MRTRVYVCARSHTIIHPCMHVFLGRALDRPTGNERSSAQTLIYSYMKNIYLYLLWLQTEASRTPPGDDGMQHRRMRASGRGFLFIQNISRTSLSLRLCERALESTMIKGDGSNREEKRRYHTEYFSALVPSQTENVLFLP